MKWHFVLITWNVKHGMLLFVDGPLVAQSSDKVLITDVKEIGNQQITIGKCSSHLNNNCGFGKVSLEMVVVFNTFVPSGKVFLSYSYTGLHCSFSFLFVIFVNYTKHITNII